MEAVNAARAGKSYAPTQDDPYYPEQLKFSNDAGAKSMPDGTGKKPPGLEQFTDD